MNEEHRKSNRYRLALPMIFRWQDALQVRHEGVGLTRDLGIKGAFVMTGTPPPLQAKIKLTAYIPLVDGAGICMRLDGEGMVVRVEAVKHRTARRGFAVAGIRFIVRRSEM